MKKIKSNIIEYLNIIFEESCVSLKFDPNLVQIQYSKNPKISDFQCNTALKLSVIYKKPAIEIANNMINLIKKNPNISDINVTGPGFINIKISNQFISSLINKNYNIKKYSNNKTIFLDFGGANIAKILHVGHLRSLLLGDFLQKIYKFFGYNVISDFHLGDWGAHIGTVILEILDQKKNKETSKFTLEELSNFYKIGCQKSVDNKDNELKAKKITFLIQNNDKFLNKIWKNIVNISLSSFKNHANDLNIKFNLWNAESTIKNSLKDIISTLIQKKIAKVDNKATIIPLGYYPPLMLLNSEKIFMYAATDLATIIDRLNKYTIDKIIYIVDKRQTLHFKQLFLAAAKIVDLSNINLIHIPFGTLNYKDHKPLKSRLGRIISLQEILISVNNRIKNKILSLNKEKIINHIVLSTIKYSILINNNIKNIIFDIKSSSNYEGKTGPYILYSAVRIKSILRKIDTKKYKNIKFVLKAAIDNDEKFLHLLILEFNHILEKSFKDHDPSYLCEYIYKLAVNFNRFYAKSIIYNIKNDEITNSRIALCKIILKQFNIICSLLNIEIPEYM